MAIELSSVATYVALSIGIVNVSLLGGLIYAYWKTYKEVKSEFTVGLIFFASFLLIQNIASALFLALQLIFPYTAPLPELYRFRIPLLIINLVQLIALLILFKITRK